MVDEPADDERVDGDQKVAFSAAEQERLNQQLRQLLAKVQAVRQQTIKVKMSPGLFDWFCDNGVNLLFSTRRASKLFCLGQAKEEKKISIVETDFKHCGALSVHGQRELFLSTQQKIWRMHNAVPKAKSLNGFQRFFVPQQAFVTGELNVQDMAVNSRGRVIFVNSLFSCLAGVSDTHSFVPLWKPAFISDLVSEERCFLSGVALLDDEPKFVTAAAQTNTAAGWKQAGLEQGVVIDVPTNEVVASGLQRPYCPRFYQGRLWLLESGSGYLGYVDLSSGQFHQVAFLPGCVRSVDFVNHYAIVGVSRLHTLEDNVVSNLLSHASQRHGRQLCCGLFIIDLNSGETVGHLTFDKVIDEITSVAVLKDVKHAAIVGPQSEEMNRIITIAEPLRRVAPSTLSRH